MKRLRGEHRTEQLRLRRERRRVRHLALKPDLSEARGAPVGEEADAVSAGNDLIKVRLHLRERQVFVNVLSQLERRQNIERQFRHDAKSTQADDHPLKLFTLLFAG